MEVTKIMVSSGRTLNLGNYSSAKIDASIEVKLKEGADVAEAYNYAWQIVKAQVKDQCKEYGQ